MKKKSFIKFLIPFVLTCLNNGTRACEEPTNEQVLSRINQEQYWQGMWFDDFESGVMWGSKCRIWAENPKVDTDSRLKMISPLMGCAYGVKLHWFLLLTLDAIELYNIMKQQENDVLADRYFVELENSIERGRSAIIHLMGTLQYINSIIKRPDSDDKFHKILSDLNGFITRKTPIVYTGLCIPGGLIINEMFKEVAYLVRNLLISTCSPNFRVPIIDYQLFNNKALMNKYNSKIYENRLFAFYIDELDSCTGYISNHLIQLGFYYQNIPVAHEIPFDLNQSPQQAVTFSPT